MTMNQEVPKTYVLICSECGKKEKSDVKPDSKYWQCPECVKKLLGVP